MPKYVAFLRAINVGGHNVKMDHLRSLFETMGFTNVETFIASGNVIFDSRMKNTTSVEQKVEADLRDSLGYEVVTFIRTTSEVAEIAASRPFTASKLNEAENTLYIGLMKATPSKAASEKLLKQSSAGDLFHINGREVYWLRCGKLVDSKFSMASIEKLLEQRATFRNVNTVQRLAAKYY